MTSDSTTSRSLQHLLSESVAEARERERQTFDRMAGSSSGLVIFGAGNLGQRTLSGAKSVGLTVHCFADNRESLWGTELQGVAVLTPADAVRKFPDATFILCIWSDNLGHPLTSVQEQLNALGKVKVVSFNYLFWKYPLQFLPYWRCDAPHKTLEQLELVRAAEVLWSDEFSKREYVAQINWRLQGDFSTMQPPVKGDQYFVDELFELADTEVFVDCGAFNGDTLKVFIDRTNDQFRAYHAFEPDPENFIALRQYVTALPENIRKKISTSPWAIGSRKDRIPFEASGSLQSGFSEKGTVMVDAFSLDSLTFTDPPTFIKMDVEGYESNIIFGAARLIIETKPIIAISIYHKFDHLWRLPLAIHALSSDYSFFLRAHKFGGWELVCYAVPKHRLK